MKVIDRFLGTEVDLPNQVEPGRYRLKRSAVLNEEINLNAGDVLGSDGGHRCDLEGQPERDFLQTQYQSGEDQAPESIIDDAVQAVVDAWRADTTDLPAPVLPSSLGELAHPTPLELVLEQVLKKGHLQSIAARPRMNMRYYNEMLPVARSRRIAKDAVTRLASHSEDWLRRDLGGVVPRSLKSEISEDDLVIYENIVFVRLLDRLEHILRRRLRTVETLQRKHAEAAALSNAQQLDYRLRDALCRLWGLAFTDNSELGQSTTVTIYRIHVQLGKIRQLKRSDIYLEIPQSIRIPLALRNTNILQHDSHYRHLRPLWLLAHANASAQVSSSVQRFAMERQKGERFARYVGLMARHALAACTYVQGESGPNRYRVGTRALELAQDAGDWCLRLQGALHPLRLVPGWRWTDGLNSSNNRMVVFCHRPGNPTDSAFVESPGADGVLHPLEFYSVERVRQAIERWLFSALLAQWPARVTAIPTRLRQSILDLAPEAVFANRQGIVVVRPVDDGIRKQIEAQMSSAHANEDTRRAIVQAFDDAEFLATCRLCGELVPSIQLLTSPNGWRATCKCNHRWSIKYQEDSVTQAVFQVENEARTFNEVGSLAFTVYPSN